MLALRPRHFIQPVRPRFPLECFKFIGPTPKDFRSVPPLLLDDAHEERLPDAMVAGSVVHVTILPCPVASVTVHLSRERAKADTLRV